MPLVGDLVAAIVELVVGMVDAAGGAVFVNTWRWKRRLLVAALILLPLVLVLIFVLV